MSTSLKHWAYEYENGRKFEVLQIQGAPFYVHRFYPTVVFEKTQHVEGHTRIAVVRNPVDRFLSMYRNRVLSDQPSHRESRIAIQESNLPVHPDLETFVRDFQQYREVSWEIAHHSKPQVEYLGNRMDFYNQVFSMNQVSALEAFLAQLTGGPVALPHDQKTNRHLQFNNPQTGNPIDLASVQSQIADLYPEDFEVYGTAF